MKDRIEVKNVPMRLIFWRKPFLILAALFLGQLVSGQVLPSTMRPVTPPPPRKIKPVKVKTDTIPTVTESIADSIVTDKDIPNFNMDAWKNKVLKKTKQLNDYISLISSPQTDPDQASKTVNQAVALFVNEEARVEVSNVNTNTKKKYKIRDYLDRLQQNSSQFDNVKINYAHVSYATNFKLGADGNYHASVTFVQTFTGFIDGKVAYSDKTKKSMEVVAKKYEKNTDSGSEAVWDLFLSDIGVVQTKSAGN